MYFIKLWKNIGAKTMIKKNESEQICKIGTRGSALALWQAQNVQKKLQDKGHKTELVPVKSAGDLELDIPLYDMGITGIFTKSLVNCRITPALTTPVI